MKLIAIAALFFILSIALHTVSADTLQANKVSPEPSIQPNQQKSLEAFKTVMAVLKDPRCINCHPVGDHPMQGDENRLHDYNVSREKSCNMCHGEKNTPAVPGAPHWQLAPKSMGWYGLSDVAIGERLLDPEQNGNRTPEDLVHHMTNDALETKFPHLSFYEVYSY